MASRIKRVFRGTAVRKLFVSRQVKVFYKVHDIEWGKNSGPLDIALRGQGHKATQTSLKGGWGMGMPA